SHDAAAAHDPAAASDGGVGAVDAGPCPNNLVANPGFDTGISDWAAMAWVQAGHDKPGAAQSCGIGYQISTRVPFSVTSNANGENLNLRLQAWLMLPPNQAATNESVSITCAIQEIGSQDPIAGSSKSIDAKVGGSW